jgi:hypothetical protein
MKPETLLITLTVTALAVAAIACVRYEMSCQKARKIIPSLITDKWIRGRDLRQRLSKDGIHLSYASFYMVMNDLVKQGKAIYRDTSDSDGRIREFRLPQTIEERKSEAADYVARLGR